MLYYIILHYTILYHTIYIYIYIPLSGHEEPPGAAGAEAEALGAALLPAHAGGD